MVNYLPCLHTGNPTYATNQTKFSLLAMGPMNSHWSALSLSTESKKKDDKVRGQLLTGQLLATAKCQNHWRMAKRPPTTNENPDRTSRDLAKSHTIHVEFLPITALDEKVAFSLKLWSPD